MATEETYKVAVYGSLRKGLYNHYLLEEGKESIFLKEVKVEIPFKMISMGDVFPALIHSKENNKITLELYSISFKVFKNLDILEGYPNFYSRKKISIDGDYYWVYYLSNLKKPDNEILVESGDWKLYKIKLKLNIK